VEANVLFVEDDRSIREVTTLELRQAGFQVRPCGDGREGLDAFAQDQFDLVLLDVMLPGLDGFEVCREIRRSHRTPIIMLTARTDTVDVVVGLELGADDYVSKPFQPVELVARMRAVLRRAQVMDGDVVRRVGDLTVDEPAFRATLAGCELSLTATEFRLLSVFARRPGQVFTREMLLELVWGYEFLGDSRLVNVAVQRLRAKIEVDPSHPVLITAVRGVGYRLERPSAPADSSAGS
jgi:two-component system, OmpR family, response regulator MtrA